VDEAEAAAEADEVAKVVAEARAALAASAFSVPKVSAQRVKSAAAAAAEAAEEATMEDMEPFSGCAGGGEGGGGESPELEGASAMTVRRLCVGRIQWTNEEEQGERLAQCLKYASCWLLVWPNAALVGFLLKFILFFFLSSRYHIANNNLALGIYHIIIKHSSWSVNFVNFLVMENCWTILASKCLLSLLLFFLPRMKIHIIISPMSNVS